MNVGVIGLGKMGQAVAYRLLRAGFSVCGFDQLAATVRDFGKDGGIIADSPAALAQNVSVIWLMVPAGEIVDEVIESIKPVLQSGQIIIDGGNSHYTDSVRRAQALKALGIAFLDCGTSGGIHGKEQGFSLMIGGDKEAYEKSRNIFQALAAPQGYAYMGPSGAGHYVKMVHNGIEYALLQAYGEGFELLKENSQYRDLDLATISRVWSHGSVIRSWLLDLAHEVLQQDQKLDTISGKVGGGSTGRWTVEEAHEQNIAVPLIEQALLIRDHSKHTGGSYATKIVALLRNKFGGHAVQKVEE